MGDGIQPEVCGNSVKHCVQKNERFSGICDGKPKMPFWSPILAEIVP